MSITIGDAIARFEEAAERNQMLADRGVARQANLEYAEENRQLTGWLRELHERRQPWIPCSERLPEKSDTYLVTMTQKADAEDLGFELDDIIVRKLRFNCCEKKWCLPRHSPEWLNGVIVSEVTAWMPMPLPYRPREVQFPDDTAEP